MIERYASHSDYTSLQCICKIAEGCNNGCTFCIIPKVRGAFRSRTIESIKAEVERLAASGVKEVVLIAQDTTSYGIDLNDGTPLLTTLLKALTTVEGIEWIRMLTYIQHSSLMNC